MRRRSGIVVDAEVGHPVAGATVRQLDADGAVLGSATSGGDGRWRLPPAPGLAEIVYGADGFCEKRFAVGVLKRGSGNTIKLMPAAPVAYLGRLDASPGEQLALRVHATGSWNYTLHRHGLRRTAVLRGGPFPAAPQQVPDGPFVADGLDWPVAATIDLPGDLHSGLYSLTVEDYERHRFTLPLAVGPGGRRSGDGAPFLVVANTNTWQAYNVWGGKSRYRNFDRDPVDGSIVPVAAGRFTLARLRLALLRRLLWLWLRFPGGPPVSGIRLEPSWIGDRLSLLRPFPNRWLDADSPVTPYLDHLAANEWRALAWLEREGFAYDYCSDERLHRGGVDLSAYRGVILAGHAEYWTAAMYQRLHEAVAGGVALLNLSGNAIYQEVSLDEKGAIRPLRGEFRETCADSSELTGVRTALDIGGFAPFRLEEGAAGHWALQGVAAESPEGEDGALVGRRSLIDLSLATGYKRYDPLAPGVLRGAMGGNGASGWEVDKLHGAEGRSTTLLASGLNTGGGAHMFVIEEAGGGLLFSASSIAFVSSLLVDPAISRITLNVLDRLLAEGSA